MHRTPAGRPEPALPPARAARRAFQAAKPFPHLVFERFVGVGFFRELAAQFPAPRRSGAGGYAERVVLRDIRRAGPAYAALDGFLRSPRFLGWVAETAGLPWAARNPQDTCGGLIQDGHAAQLEPHLDVNCTVPALRRRATLILYLNERWREDWGGALELFAAKDQPPRRRLLPLPGRAVLLQSGPRAWHGVEPIALPPARRSFGRRALIVNFYAPGRERPHFQMWTPRPLSVSLRPGKSLSPEESAVLRGALERRLELLRELRALELAAGARPARAASAGLPAGALAGAPLSSREVSSLEGLFAGLDRELARLYRREHSHRRALEARAAGARA